MGGAGTLRWVFAVHPPNEESAVVTLLRREHDLYQDLLLLPSVDRSTESTGGPNTDQFLQVLATLRDFQFRWLLVTRQDVFIHADRLLQHLQGVEPPGGKVLGAWSTEPPRLDPHFFMMPRDVFVLLSAPEVISRLASSGFDAFGDQSLVGFGRSSWLLSSGESCGVAGALA